jgi:hypothetical protein
MLRPSWFVLMLDTADGEEVVDLPFEDTQTPVPVFGFGLQTALGLRTHTLEIAQDLH